MRQMALRGLSRLVSSPSGVGRHSRVVLTRLPQFLTCTESGTQSRCFSSSANEAIKAPIEHEFQAETLKLLNIMSRSLYTDREVFVRELISNSNDALEKMRFLESSGKASAEGIPLEIHVAVDQENRIITISDSGVGMTETELVANLGTIAKSGGVDFLETYKLQEGKNADLIGQFGVGFYSVFVVAKKVEVLTRSYLPGSPSLKWTSDGAGKFTVEEFTEELPRGTQVVCHLREDCEGLKDSAKIKEIARCFSSFSSFPLKFTEIGKHEVEELGAGTPPIWMQKTATDAEHQKFFEYLAKTAGLQAHIKPLYALLYSADSPLSIKSALYIPSEGPNKLFQRTDNKSHVSLYCKKVLVSKEADKIIPKWLNFIHGVIDCEDIPLNVSREFVQDNGLLDKLSRVIVKKLLRFLDDQAKLVPEKYSVFWKEFGLNLKEGLLEDQRTGGRFKNEIVNLLRFHSSESSPDDVISLESCLNQMHPDSKNLYFFAASNYATAMASPYLVPFKARGIPVLILNEEIDEFAMMHIGTYKDRKVVAIDACDEDLLTPDLDLVKPKDEPVDGENVLDEPLVANEQTCIMDFFRNTLGQKLSSVEFSNNLSAGVPAVAHGFLPVSLRRIMRASGANESALDNMPISLKLNAKDSIFKGLFNLLTHEDPTSENMKKAEILVRQIYLNATIAAGVVDDARDLLSNLQQLVRVFSGSNTVTSERTSAPAAVMDALAQNVEESTFDTNATSNKDGVSDLSDEDAPSVASEKSSN